MFCSTRIMAKTPSATTGIASGVTSPNAVPMLVCQAGIAGGTSSEARASTATTGKDRAPSAGHDADRAERGQHEPGGVRHRSSSTISAASSPQRVQNRASGKKIGVQDDEPARGEGDPPA